MTSGVEPTPGIAAKGFIAIFISFYLFREYNRVQRAKRNERCEHLNERRQELLNKVIKKKKENSNED